MSFTTEIKKLSAFLKEQGFLSVPQNVVRGMRSWVKEPDGENLVYLYVCVKQHGKGTSPARNARTPSIPLITASGGFFRIMPNRQKKYLRPYTDEIIMEYIDSYTSGLSMILATYGAFR